MGGGSAVRMALAGLALLFAPAVAVGQSLSDLDLSGFEQQSGKGEEAAPAHANPFTSGVSTADDLAVEDLQLSGVVYRSESEAYALVSGYLVQAGDRIAGYRVDNVEKEKVILRRSNEVVILALGGGI